MTLDELDELANKNKKAKIEETKIEEPSTVGVDWDKYEREARYYGTQSKIAQSQAESVLNKINNITNRKTLTDYYMAYTDDMNRAYEGDSLVDVYRDRIITNAIKKKIKEESTAEDYISDWAQEVGGNIRGAIANTATWLGKTYTQLEGSEKNLNAAELEKIVKADKDTPLTSIGNQGMVGSNTAVNQFNMLTQYHEMFPNDDMITFLYNSVANRNFKGSQADFKDLVKQVNEKLMENRFNTSTIARNTADEYEFLRNLKQREALSWDGLGKFYLDAVGTVANMAPAIATSFATGGTATALGASKAVAGTAAQAGSLAMLGTGASGSAFREKLDQGYNFSRASAYGDLIGAVEVGTELIGGDAINSALFGKVATTPIGKATAELIKKSNITNRIVQGAISLVSNVGGEALEEVIAGAIDPVIGALVLDEDINLNEYTRGIYEDAVGSLVPSLILGGFGHVQTVKAVDVMTERMKQDIQESVSLTDEQKGAMLKELDSAAADARWGLTQNWEKIYGETESALNRADINNLETLKFANTTLQNPNLTQSEKEARINEFARQQGGTWNTSQATIQELQDTATTKKATYTDMAKINKAISNLMQENPDVKSVDVVTDINKVQENIKKLVERLTGKEVVYVNPDTTESLDYGFMNDDGNVYINSNLDTKGTLAAAYHEIGHYLKTTNPDLYNEFIKRANPTKEQIDNYRAAVNDSLTDEQAKEEMFGDYIGEVMSKYKNTAAAEGSVKNIFDSLKELAQNTASKVLGTEKATKVTDYNLDLASYMNGDILNDTAFEQQVLNAFTGIKDTKQAQKLAKTTSEIVKDTPKAKETPKSVYDRIEQRYAEMKDTAKRPEILKMIADELGKKYNNFNLEALKDPEVLRIFNDLKPDGEIEGTGNKLSAKKVTNELKVSSNLSNDIDLILKQQYPNMEEAIKVKDYTPNLLIKYGKAKPLAMYTKATELRDNLISKSKAKRMGVFEEQGNYHNIGKALYIEVIDSIDDPIAIIKSKSPTGKKNTLIIITDLVKDGEQIIVPVQLDDNAMSNNVSVDTNRVKSVYGKFDIRKYVEETLKENYSNLVYLTKDKNRRGIIDSRRLQLSDTINETSSNKNNISSQPKNVNTVKKSSRKNLPESDVKKLENANNRLRDELVKKDNKIQATEMNAKRTERAKLNKTIRGLRTKIERNTDTAKSKLLATEMNVKRTERAKANKKLSALKDRMAQNQEKANEKLTEQKGITKRVRNTAKAMEDTYTRMIRGYLREIDKQLAIGRNTEVKFVAKTEKLTQAYINEKLRGEFRKAAQGSGLNFSREYENLYIELRRLNDTPKEAYAHVVAIKEQTLRHDRAIDNSIKILKELRSKKIYNKLPNELKTKIDAYEKIWTGSRKQSDLTLAKRILMSNEAKQLMARGVNLTKRVQNQIMNLNGDDFEGKGTISLADLFNGSIELAEAFEKGLAELRQEVADFQARDMIGERTQRMLNTIQSIEQAVTNEMDAQDKLKVKSFLRPITGNKTLANSQMTLKTEIQALMGGNVNTPMMKLNQNFQNAELRKKQAIVSIYKKLDDFMRKSSGANRLLNVEKWSKDLEKALSIDAKFIDTGMSALDENGRRVDIKLPKSLIMSLALHLRNAENMAHISGAVTSIQTDDEGNVHVEYGKGAGVRIPNEELFRRGNESAAYARGRTVRLSEEQVEGIVKTLTEEEKAFVDAVADIFKYTSSLINEVSNRIVGYDQATVENYFPIRVWNREDKAGALMLNPMKQQMYGDALSYMLNPGWLQERVTSFNPIYLENIAEVLNRVVNNVTNYYGYAEALLDNHIILSEQLQKNIEYLSSDFMKDYNKLTRFITGQERRKDGGFRGLMAMNTLTFNVGTWLTQPMSFFNTLKYFTGKEFMSAINPANNNMKLNKMIRDYFNELGIENDKYSDYEVARAFIALATPNLEYRAIGYKIPELNQLFNKRLQDKLGVHGIEAFDNIAVTAIARMMAWSVGMHTEFGSSEYFDELGERLTEVLVETQPEFSEVNRANMFRSSNGVMRTLSLFGTPANQMFNNFLQSAMQLRYEAREGKISNGAKLSLAKSITGILMSSAMVGLIRALRDRIRSGDDDDEEFKDRWVAQSVIAALGPTLILDDLAQLIMATNKFGGMNSYDFNTPETTFMNGIQRLITSIMNLGNDTSPSRKITDIIKALGTITPIDTKSVIRVVEAMLKVVAPDIYSSYQLQNNSTIYKKWLEHSDTDMATFYKAYTATRESNLKANYGYHKADKDKKIKSNLKESRRRALEDVLDNKRDVDKYMEILFNYKSQ